MPTLPQTPAEGLTVGCPGPHPTPCLPLGRMLLCFWRVEAAGACQGWGHCRGPPSCPVTPKFTLHLHGGLAGCSCGEGGEAHSSILAVFGVMRGEEGEVKLLACNCISGSLPRVSGLGGNHQAQPGVGEANIPLDM